MTDMGTMPERVAPRQPPAGQGRNGGAFTRAGPIADASYVCQHGPSQAQGPPKLGAARYRLPIGVARYRG